jgi:hypothetical protein
VNGDGACDVLDVQAVTAALLHAPNTAKADINRDGGVNLLDLQRAVAAASNLPGAQEAPESSPQEPVLLQAQVDAPVVKPQLCGVLPVAAPGAPVARAATVARELDSLPTPAEERFMLQLTPHAPPLPA